MATLDIKLKVDASGLSCPLPILKATQGIKSVASGELIEVVATDPGSVKDFDAFAKQTGDELVESREEGGKFHFLIKKA